MKITILKRVPVGGNFAEAGTDHEVTATEGFHLIKKGAAELFKPVVLTAKKEAKRGSPDKD